VGFFTKFTLTELIAIARADDPAVDVIFVHGLDGDPLDTWAMRNEENWQTWIAKAVPRANIWALGYRLRTSKWFGGSMPMTTRAVNVLATLDAELSDKLPIVFVCHSYGGLLVKQMLRSGSEIANGYEALTERVAGIVFLGTPNSGSSIANYAKALGFILRTSPAIQEMQRNQHELQELNYWFRKRAQTSKWLLRVYFETLPTFGLIVVDEASADIGVSSVTPTGVDANHIHICKPLRADFRVKQTQALIEEVARRGCIRGQQSWMGKIILASNDQLPLLRKQIEYERSADPGNHELLLALAHLDTLYVSEKKRASVTERIWVELARPSRLRGTVAAIAVLFVSSFAVMTILQERTNGPQALGPLPPLGSPARPDAETGSQKSADSSAAKPADDVAHVEVEAVRRFLQRYAGGDCFFIMPVAIGSRSAVLEGFGSSTAPFELLDSSFKKTLGFEPSIGVRLVTPPQCPAISFLDRVRSGASSPPRISLGSVNLKQGEALAGYIENVGNSVVELLLVMDDGQVQNLSDLVKEGTGAFSFEVRRSGASLASSVPQLVMAVASPSSLVSLKKPATPADQFFPQVLDEAQRTNIPIKAIARYFTIEN
jgi:hypothetical protein